MFHAPMTRTLIALLYSPSERKAAHEVLNLFTETLPDENPWADLLVFPRFDAKGIERHTLLAVGSKFEGFSQVVASVPKQYEVADPDQVVDSRRDQVERNSASLGQLLSYAAGAFPEYPAVLAIRPDICPIDRDWLPRLRFEWDELGVAALGCWTHETPCGGDVTNVLGALTYNFMFRPSLVTEAPSLMATPKGYRWDHYHAATLKKLGWQGTHLIAAIPASHNFGLDEARAMRQDQKAVLIHGACASSLRGRIAEDLK
jgi:hypothetical protein